MDKKAMKELKEIVKKFYIETSNELTVLKGIDLSVYEEMRVLLTMLGIIIGIASVIAIMTVGSSLTSFVTDSMSSALGAPNSSIRLQFIVESIVICLMGGVIGIVLGVILGVTAASLLGSAATPSPGSIVLSITFSMAIGVFFGYYPANKAAKMDPIDTLRYE